MRINSVKLERFGALRGIFSLDPKITVIYGPNESGKSTLHTALRVALVGVDLASRGRLPKESEQVLRRFKPWRGRNFKLEADVELGSGRYQFVRDLDQPDNAQVLDQVRGGDVTDQFRRGRTVDVSVMLGMSREAFLAISTVAQDQILEISGPALQADLQRAISTSGAHTSVRSALELLRKWRQENLRGERSRERPMDRAVRELATARDQLAMAVDIRQRLGEELSQLEVLRERLEEAERAAEESELLWKSAEMAELDQDLLAISEIDQALRQIPDVEMPPDPQAIRDAASGANQLAAQVAEAEAKVAELTPGDPAKAKLAAELSVSELQFLGEAVERPVPPLPAQAGAGARLELLDRRKVALHRWSSDLLALAAGIIGVVLIVRAVTATGAALPVEEFLGGVVVLVAGAAGFLYLQQRLRRLLAVGGFTSVAEMRRARRSRDPEVMKVVAAQEEVLAQRSKAQRRIAELGLSHFDGSRLLELAAELPPLQEALRQAASWRATADRARGELMARAARVGIEETDPQQIAARLAELSQELEAAVEAERRRGELQLRREERLNGRELHGLVSRAQELRAELGARGRGPQPRPGRSAAELREEYDRLRSDRDRLRDELLPKEGSLRQQLKEAGDLVELEELVAERRAVVERMEHAEAAVNLAITELEAAEAEIQNSLAPILADGLAHRLPELTHRRYAQAWVNPEDLSMHVAAANSTRQIPVDNLSQGTQEQIYVCLRMVLAQALSPRGEQLPLIFDDPTVNSDDRRCFALLDTLLELSETSQVVIFSHEHRVVEWAQRQSVPVLALDQVPASADEDEAAAATSSN